MADEPIKETGNDTPADPSTKDYLDAINQLKANSVSKSDYDKLKADNKELLNAIVNGTYIEPPAQPAPQKDLHKLREKVFNEDQTNLQYWTNVLELRNELINRGERDPFLPYGNKIIPTNDDYESAQRVANVVQQCIDYANGDSAVFTNELQRRTVDSALPGNTRRK